MSNSESTNKPKPSKFDRALFFISAIPLTILGWEASLKGIRDEVPVRFLRNAAEKLCHPLAFIGLGILSSVSLYTLARANRKPDAHRAVANKELHSVSSTDEEKSSRSYSFSEEGGNKSEWRSSVRLMRPPSGHTR